MKSYYLTHRWEGDKGVQTFPKDICQKGNVIAWLTMTLQFSSHYTTGTPPNANEERLTPPNANEERLTTLNANEERLTTPNANEERLTPPNVNEERLTPPNAYEESLTPPNANEERLAVTELCKLNTGFIKLKLTFQLSK